MKTHNFIRQKQLDVSGFCSYQCDICGLHEDRSNMTNYPIYWTCQGFIDEDLTCNEIILMSVL